MIQFDPELENAGVRVAVWRALLSDEVHIGFIIRCSDGAATFKLVRSSIDVQQNNWPTKYETLQHLQNEIATQQARLALET